MYEVSNAYKMAMARPYKIRQMTGTIGQSTTFSDVNIAQGSFHWEHQCTEGQEVKIGTVYMGQITCTFRGINLKGQWNKKVIRPTEKLLVGYNAQNQPIWESVPLGVFTVYQADHREDGVAITAYDNMKKTDKKFKLSTTSGTPYDLLKLIETNCKITLAQTREEIRALPNGTRGYVLYAENDIETYRDFLSWIAQTLGCFATFNREGKLELRQYGDVTEPVDIIHASDRWTGASFSDFETYYTGLSLTKIEDESTKYVALDPDDGLTYNLGGNPFLQNANPDPSLEGILHSLQRINYTPFELDRSGYVAYDLGDVVEFRDGNGDFKTGCIMAIDYEYHGAFSIKGFGSNPALADARSKSDKQIAGLTSKGTVSSVMQYYTYTNAKPIAITSDYKDIIKIRFGALKSTVVVFHAEIKLNAEYTGAQLQDEIEKVIGDIKYLFNGVEVPYAPKETWIEGTHLLHLLYYLVIDDVSANTLTVKMKTDGKITIGRQGIQAIISGQGLVASDVWDGYIEVEDRIAPAFIETEPVGTDALGETASLRTPSVIRIQIGDSVSVSEIANEPERTDAFDTYPYINKSRMKDFTWGYIKDHYTWGEVFDLFGW